MRRWVLLQHCRCCCCWSQPLLLLSHLMLLPAAVSGCCCVRLLLLLRVLSARCGAPLLCGAVSARSCVHAYGAAGITIVLAPAPSACTARGHQGILLQAHHPDCLLLRSFQCCCGPSSDTPERFCVCLQREGIKTYCSNLIIKISTDEKAFRSERTFLNKLNLVSGCLGALPRRRLLAGLRKTGHLLGVHFAQQADPGQWVALPFMRLLTDETVDGGLFHCERALLSLSSFPFCRCWWTS